MSNQSKPDDVPTPNAESQEKGSIVIQYTELLRANGDDPNAAPVRAFREANSDDPVEVQRMDTIDRFLPLKWQRRGPGSEKGPAVG